MTTLVDFLETCAAIMLTFVGALTWFTGMRYFDHPRMTLGISILILAWLVGHG